MWRYFLYFFFTLCRDIYLHSFLLCLSFGSVYPDGQVCISILHAPGDDPMGYESSSERWSPVQSVEKILLSVVSMLAGRLSPITFSFIDIFNSHNGHKKQFNVKFITKD